MISNIQCEIANIFKKGFCTILYKKRQRYVKCNLSNSFYIYIFKLLLWLTWHVKFHESHDMEHTCSSNWNHMLAENQGMIFSTASRLNRYPLDHLVKRLLLTTRTFWLWWGTAGRCPPLLCRTPARRSTPHSHQHVSWNIQERWVNYTHLLKDHQLNLWELWTSRHWKLLRIRFSNTDPKLVVSCCLKMAGNRTILNRILISVNDNRTVR